MKVALLFKNLTIKQANIITVLIIFFFSIIFVTLLVEDMYKDYEIALEQNLYQNNNDISSEVYISQKNEKLKSILIKTILAIVTLSFILFAISLGIYNVFHSLLNRDIEKFLDFFENVANGRKNINPKEIFFKDFKKMVTYANNMAHTIAAQKNNLEELNQGLENRIKEKTKNLQITNQNLLEEKKLRDELLKSQKEFLRYTVHETNTPLSVILTSIELLEMENKKDRQLSKIEVAAKNIFNIYDDLSYLVKKDQIQYPKTSINLVSFLASRVEFFADVAEFSKIKLNFIPADTVVYIYFNETKLQRIVDNNITNAIKYTLPNEVVNITLSVEGAWVEFSISSKSKIIKDTQKIFDAYYRESKDAHGFGLGLGLVRNICNEENVKIIIDSSEDSTSFRYRFKMMGE